VKQQVPLGIILLLNKTRLSRAGRVAWKKEQEIFSHHRLKKSLAKRLLEDHEVRGITLKWISSKML
jgi:hypothetical protein